MTRMVRSKGYEPRFDINVMEGDEGEQIVADILGLASDRIEVKRKSYLDAQFYVEYEHDPGRSDRYVPSGIQTTTASYWAFVINDTGVTVLIPTRRLRRCFELVMGRYKAETHGSCPTRGRLISINDILKVDIHDGGQQQSLLG